MEPIYCDITEVVTNPLRTGIQRVVRELLRHWTSDRPLRLCRFDRDSSNLVTIPDYVTYYLLEPDRPTRSQPVSWIKAKISELLSQDSEVVPLGSTILVPEVFFDELRCHHYIWRLQHDPDRIHIIYYDMIPWLQPDVIGVERSHPLMWYIKVAQRVQRAAFISEATRSDWRERILRDVGRTGEILPLGADGLQLSKLAFEPRKRSFVALGSIDGRKNQLDIVRAFKLLWHEGIPAELILIGRVFASESSAHAELKDCAAIPYFTHIEHATDEEASAILADARATIYASKVEGYGLPPVESLFAGIPCIVSRQVPSVANLTGGVRFLDEVSPELIAAAVRSLLNDREAEKAWSEAADLDLSTWKDFGSAVGRWIG